MKEESGQKKSTGLFGGRAVIAAAFSPRAVALLNESRQLLECLGMTPIIVHVGDPTPENAGKMEKAVAESLFSSAEGVKLELRNGDPEAVLQQVARDHEADLIIAGALPREGFWQYYLGSVARNLARSAPCSVLLYANPLNEPVGLHKIHHAVEFHRSQDVGVDLAASLAMMSGARDLYFTHTFHIPESMLKKKKSMTAEDYKRIYSLQDRRLQKYLAKQLAWEVPYHAQTLNERDHSSSLAFARDIGADLFIINAPKKQGGLWYRLFPNDLEQILHDLPCSILIARKKSIRRTARR